MPRAAVLLAVFAVVLAHGYQCASGLLGAAPAVMAGSAIPEGSAPVAEPGDAPTVADPAGERDRPVVRGSCVAQTPLSVTAPAAPQVREPGQDRAWDLSRAAATDVPAAAPRLSRLCVLRT